MYSLLPSQTETRLEQQQILVVEDETLIREAIVLALSEEGYKVLGVDNGRKALDLMEAFGADDHHPDSPFGLVILDLMLPSLNGLDFCRLLRHKGSKVPILMLSARSTETDRVVGLEVGADDYLNKPFGMRELIARCRALLRRAEQGKKLVQGQPPLQFGEIVLHPSECRVTVRGETVNLAPKEFTLLELFLRNPRRVMSRDSLLDKVWGADFIGDPKTVDVHIRWLREKIEIDPSHPQYLVTVRGFGYRLG